MNHNPKAKQRKIGIRRKITLTIFSSTIITIALGIIISYFFAFNALRDSLGKEYVQMSEMLASFVKESFHDELENAMTYATRTMWKEAIVESNAKYEKMDNETVKIDLLNIDKRWIKSNESDSILKEHLNNKTSASMHNELKLRTTISEILITDKFGGLYADDEYLALKLLNKIVHHNFWGQFVGRERNTLSEVLGIQQKYRAGLLFYIGSIYYDDVRWFVFYYFACKIFGSRRA